MKTNKLKGESHEVRVERWQMPDDEAVTGRIVGRRNLRYSKPFILRETDFVLKTAIVTMVDRHSDGTYHHTALTLYKFKRSSKKNAFPDKPEEEFTVEASELKPLRQVLDAIPQLSNIKGGNIYIIAGSGQDIRLLGSDEGQAAVRMLLNASRRGTLDTLLQTAQLEPSLLENIGAAARHIHYQQRIKELVSLVEDNPTEPKFQQWFKGNFWIFGTEYIDVPEIRQISRECNIDILLASIDGFYDVIELKRPGASVLAYDHSHSCYYPHSELSQAIGQVINYLQRMEDYRSILRLDENLLLLKPRGRIVIGRSHDWDEEKRQALRKINASFHNIDIMTYDHLIARGKMLIKLYSDSSVAIC